MGNIYWWFFPSVYYVLMADISNGAITHQIPFLKPAKAKMHQFPFLQALRSILSNLNLLSPLHSRNLKSPSPWRRFPHPHADLTPEQYFSSTGLNLRRRALSFVAVIHSNSILLIQRRWWQSPSSTISRWNPGTRHEFFLYYMTAKLVPYF